MYYICTNIRLVLIKYKYPNNESFILMAKSNFLIKRLLYKQDL